LRCGLLEALPEIGMENHVVLQDENRGVTLISRVANHLQMAPQTSIGARAVLPRRWRVQNASVSGIVADHIPKAV
jgi:hypothetical protein